ncbi:MAG: hypothetical protein NTW84_07805, partial [Methanothrix sp.]|nr:hypothetical protein [Methanothrix sp.]
PMTIILNQFIKCEGNTTEKFCSYLRVLKLLNFLGFFCIVPIIAEMSTDYWALWVTKTTTNSATINWRGGRDGLGQQKFSALCWRE